MSNVSLREMKTTSNKCKDCKGTGVCQVCKGTGEIKKLDPHPSWYLVNPETGEVKCFGCDGKKVCFTCKGSGEKK